MVTREDMLRRRMEQRKREQQLFHLPRRGSCKDYGAEYEREAGELKTWEKLLLAVGAVAVLVMCWWLKP